MIQGNKLAAATPGGDQQIVAFLMERVETAECRVVGEMPTGPTEPFFDSALRSRWRPRTDVGAHEADLRPARLVRRGAAGR